MLRVAGYELQVQFNKGVGDRGWGVGRKTWNDGMVEEPRSYELEIKSE